MSWFTSSRLFRIAATLQLFLAVGHTMGVLSPPSRGADVDAVVEGMHRAAFDVMGTPRTFWELYMGFALLFTVFMASAATLSWQLGSDGWSATSQRRLAWTQCGAQAVVTCLCFTHFFLAPRLVSTAATVVLGLAAVRTSRSRS